MTIQVKEKDIDEIKEKIAKTNTILSKINYVESAIKESNFGLEIKRYLYQVLSELYEERKMFDRSAKAMSNKASMEITFRNKIESYLRAGELYSKALKADDADEMFSRASREANDLEKQKIKLTKKNIYFATARDLEKKMKRSAASKFYEKLITMNLEEIEKKEVKEKLVSIYKNLGMFREIKLLEGI